MIIYNLCYKRYFIWFLVNNDYFEDGLWKVSPNIELENNILILLFSTKMYLLLTILFTIKLYINVNIFKIFIFILTVEGTVIYIYYRMYVFILQKRNFVVALRITL